MTGREKVAVIGAGALGLMALKQFREDGFEAVAFETRPYVAGLWKDTDDSTISVLATTILNTSKFRAAISDFPFPEEADVYPTAAQTHAYLEGYADHFELREHIHLNHKVEHILREQDRWILQVQDTKTGTISTRRFDRVCVATGTFTTPRRPKLAGIENFTGKVLHSIDFHGSEPFNGDNVLVIGMHATAQDVTNVLSESAKHVYLSHRHGLLMLPRYNDKGEAYDTAQRLPLVMLQNWFQSHLPGLWTYMVDRRLDATSSKAFPDLPDEWGLTPRPSIATATPFRADTFYPFLKSGFAEPVPAVARVLGPRTVELTNGRVLRDIDTILYCTGYNQNIPASLIPSSTPDPSGGDPATTTAPSPFHPFPDGPGHEPRLYMNIFPLASDPAARNSLAFLGQASFLYPGLVQFELQAMAVSQVWRAVRSLPPHAEMLAWHAANLRHREALMRRYGGSHDGTFYVGLLPGEVMLPWLDSTAGTGIFEHFGGKFNGMFNRRAWRLWWHDRELYDLCVKGILSPTVYRAFPAGGRRALPRDEVVRALKRDNEVYERAVLARQKGFPVSNADHEHVE
ncbi:Uu.00g144450.m01.CDS01 [Anthostomella pinea]|uniref:Uu.00g144450.m01.CDS01 n=1 Tax=Anthostomella pinea TaxID=933095 RepID=A0AAI8VRN7_9PEZI|nr:Uu.00g144450.m01.CDS01 [Anthostomella pinea]